MARRCAHARRRSARWPGSRSPPSRASPAPILCRRPGSSATCRMALDGAVTVVNKHIEFGQGSHAGLAAIVAEELDADWDKVKIVQAPANAKVYANLSTGVQATGGSSAIANSWDQLRLAGAAA